MFAIMVGIQNTHNNNPDWDEEACPDLVNRLGKVLQRIGQLVSMQKAEVLMWAQQRGFIRAHFEYRAENHISHTPASFLNTFQVANVRHRLENAGFVDRSEMREANQDEPSVLPGRKRVHPVIFLATMTRPG
ncbi:hypothetical protein AnigIFM63309_004211 [Aspergillus niger]|nr:hypothetical protein AnigIFM63309_004211 [Aspergillus niger]